MASLPTRHLRLVASGVSGREDKMLFHPWKMGIAEAAVNVVYFGGDIQNFEDCMVEPQYTQYSVERTAEYITRQIGRPCNVFVILPSRVERGVFSCFDNFVIGDNIGAVGTYVPTEACTHMRLLFDSALWACARLLERTDPSRQMQLVSTLLELPRVWCGFSKGCVVLNQFVLELGIGRIAGERANSQLTPAQGSERQQSQQQKEEVESNDRKWVEELLTSPCSVCGGNDLGDERRQRTCMACQERKNLVFFFGYSNSFHWLDGGNGSYKGGFPTNATASKVFGHWCWKGGVGVKLHGTPYQWRAQEKPWVIPERDAFIEALSAGGLRRILHKEYFETEGPSLMKHLKILETAEFKLSV